MMHPRVPNVKRRPLVSEAILVMTIIDVIISLRFSYNPRKKLRGQNENTAEPDNCVRDLAKYVLNIAADLSSARHRAFQADGLRAFGRSNYD